MRHIPMHAFRRAPVPRVRACALSPPLIVLVLALAVLTPVGAGAIGAPLKAAGVLAAEDAGFIEITVRMCPPGYDPAESGADPERDCGQAPDGIRFTLRDDDDPQADDRHAETGQRGDSVAFFDDVASGQYELIQDVPDGVDGMIILSCSGFNTGPFYRMPLDEGPELYVPVPNNAPIRCDWLNILSPGATPQATPLATPARAG